MQNITQMLLNNIGNRLTPELVNGMNHVIKTEFDALQQRIEQLQADLGKTQQEAQ